MADQKQHPETRAIRERVDPTPHREHSSPLFLTSSFTFPSAEHMAATFAGETDDTIYSRYSNPNTDEFIAKMCALEMAEDGFATASGMAAVFSSMAAFLGAGDHIIASRAVFGSTHQILTRIFPRWGIEHTYVDPAEVDDWENYLRPSTRMLVLETPSNPGLQLVDLEAAGRFARQHKLLFNIDNCFATPYLQQPIRYGADLVVHSGTKWTDGQGRVLGGIVLGTAEAIEQVRGFCRHTGPALSPFNAWVLSKSLETLSVRMERHCDNALELATRLQEDPRLQRVLYPFLSSHPQYELARHQMKSGGGIVTIEVAGGQPAAMRFLDRLSMCSLSSNLGDTRTILTHPASTTHSKLTEEERRAVGISPGMVRISVGLEHVDDIHADIVQALDH